MNEIKNQANEMLEVDELLKISQKVVKFKPRVYFLFDGDEIVYVGSTTQFESRILSHQRSKKVFDKFAYLDCSLEQMEFIEYRYINKFNPKYNIKMMPTGGDYAPIEKIKKPLHVRMEKFKRFIDSLNLPENELGLISKSLVRAKWIEINGSWKIANDYPPITADSEYYDEFVTKGYVQSFRDKFYYFYDENGCLCQVKKGVMQ